MICLSDNEDFVFSSSPNYMFSNITSTMACIPVTIVDDRFVEDDEMLSVHLSVVNDFVELVPYGSIIIVDDDCKLIIYKDVTRN